MNKNFLVKWPLFPFLFSINSVLFFYFSYYYETTFSGMLITTLISIFILISFWYLLFKILKDLNKSAILLFVVSIFFLNFQNIVHLLRKMSIFSSNVSLLIFWHSILGQLIVFSFLLLITLLVCFLVKKITQVNTKIILYMNLFSIILIISTLFRGIYFINQKKIEKNTFENYWQNEIKAISISSDNSRGVKPDIYYIILDGFARSDVLHELYGIDDSGFIDSLRRRGFYVPSQSKTNYTQTRTSLASSINMRYLDEVAGVIGEDKSFYYPAYYMIDNSIIERFLSLLGYEMVSFESEFNYTNLSDWDIHYKQALIPDSFIQTYINTTGLSVFFNQQLYRWHYKTVNFTIDSLPLTTNLEGPQFIFAHILCPHPPFLFNEDGSLKKADKLYTTQDANYFYSSGTVEEYKEGYKDQVIFLQGKILNMIDEISNTSNEPYILVIQADHGSGMLLDQTSLAKTNTKERFGIFNAIYFFDEDYKNLYPQMTPVNTFRVILSQYFNIDKPLLEDKQYYSKYWNLFEFTLVDGLD